MTTIPSIPASIGIQAEVPEIFAERRIARARLRIDNRGTDTSPFPPGDWLKVRAAACLYSAADLDRARESILAQGEEVEANARVDEWTVVDLPLPWMVLGDYLISARVFSADERYRKNFNPDNCLFFKIRYGEMVRVDRIVLEDIYERGGYGNPIAEDELRKLIRKGVVLATDGNQILRATEIQGRLRLDPLPTS